MDDSSYGIFKGVKLSKDQISALQDIELVMGRKVVKKKGLKNS